MPVKKYETFEEAEQDTWCFEPDNDYYQRLNKFFEIANDFYKSCYPIGVHKYKTFQEAEDDLEIWRMNNAIIEKDK